MRFINGGFRNSKYEHRRGSSNRFSWDQALPGTKTERKNSQTLVGKHVGWTDTCVCTYPIRDTVRAMWKGAAYSINEERIIRCDFPTRQIEFRVGICLCLFRCSENLDECNAFTYDEALVQSTEQWNGCRKI